MPKVRTYNYQEDHGGTRQTGWGTTVKQSQTYVRMEAERINRPGLTRRWATGDPNQTGVRGCGRTRLTDGTEEARKILKPQNKINYKQKNKQEKCPDRFYTNFTFDWTLTEVWPVDWFINLLNPTPQISTLINISSVS